MRGACGIALHAPALEGTCAAVDCDGAGGLRARGRENSGWRAAGGGGGQTRDAELGDGMILAQPRKCNLNWVTS